MTMQTEIKQISDVEYEFDVTIPAEELAEELNKALRAQRRRTTMHGFRPGKVPLSLVKKLHGQEIGEALAAERVQKAYESEVLEKGAYEVLGQPVLTRLDYELDGDLHAVVRFGVRPTFELEDMSGEPLSRLVHEVTEEEVEEEIERLLENEADLVPVEEPAGPEDYVEVEMQTIDAATGTPIIGEKTELSFFLDDEETPEALRKPLVGKKAGETVRVTLAHDHDHGDAGAGAVHHTHTYDVTIREVKRREMPELDDAFVTEFTKGRLESVAALREDIRKHLEEMWEERSRELMEGEMVERLVERHPIPVPESVVGMYLESYAEDLEQFFKGEIPERFDLAGYLRSRAPDAIRQARWMFIRDKLIEQEGLEVTDEDRMARFEEMAAGEEFSADDLRKYYQVNRVLMDQLDQRLINEKVFKALEAKFDIVEKDLEAYEAEIKARKAEEEALRIAEEAEQQAAEADFEIIEGEEAEAAVAETMEETEAAVAETMEETEAAATEAGKDEAREQA
ncbi:trigger factor [Rhodocaloribacter sp.]